MNYLTNYYKNLCEQLQEQINFLENQIDEAFVRNPLEQGRATRGVTRDGFFNDPNRGRIYRSGQGYKRADDMVNLQAALEIANPIERKSIEDLLLDMADTQDPGGEMEKLPHGSKDTPKYTKGVRSAGKAGNMQSMRIALGAVKRLKGTPAFAKSLQAVREPIEREAFKRAQDSFNPFYGASFADYHGGNLSPREEEAVQDAEFDVSQEMILNTRRRNSRR